MSMTKKEQSEFDAAFNVWFESMDKGLCFEPEHADAKDIARSAANWSKEFLENRKIQYQSGEPCSNTCRHHVSHPCEECCRQDCEGVVYEPHLLDPIQK